MGQTDRQTDGLQHYAPYRRAGRNKKHCAYHIRDTNWPLCFCRRSITDARPKLTLPWRLQPAAETPKTLDTAACISITDNDENRAEVSASVPGNLYTHRTNVIIVTSAKYPRYLTFSHQLHRLGLHYTDYGASNLNISLLRSGHSTLISCKYKTLCWCRVTARRAPNTKHRSWKGL